MTWEELRSGLLALPHNSQPGEEPLLARIRSLTGNLYWEDIDTGSNRESLAAVYIFKKIADDVFFNFGQDASFSLDSRLDNGKEAMFHIEEVLTPLVKFVQASLNGQPWEGATKFLHDAVTKYLKLIATFSAREMVT